MKWIIGRKEYQIVRHHNKVLLIPLADSLVYEYTFSTLIYFRPKSTSFSPKNNQTAPLKKLWTRQRKWTTLQCFIGLDLELKYWDWLKAGAPQNKKKVDRLGPFMSVVNRGMKNSFSLEKVFALSRFESERFWEWPIQEVIIYARGNQETPF